jgi:hypothetical protein
MSDVLLSAACGSGVVEVVVGDLTEERVDAIVNAANSALAHGGGVAGAIVRRGGQGIQDESDQKAPVPVGSAVMTGSGRLPCRFVIHAVGPRWGEGDEEGKLRRGPRASRRSRPGVAGDARDLDGHFRVSPRRGLPGDRRGGGGPSPPPPRLRERGQAGEHRPCYGR